MAQAADDSALSLPRTKGTQIYTRLEVGETEPEIDGLDFGR